MAKLDPRFTFENFVVGPANRLASAAARRAAERPGVSYNPLFIHAPVGLGKTHILGAIARHVERVYPDKVVGYQTAQEFLRGFVLTSKGDDGEEISERYRELDILLLDDVHYLSTQADVQDRLLLTLDTLTGEGKQVVLTSDRLPAEIGGLGAHLRTRFEGGLLVDIGPPEYETRVALVKKWLNVRLKLLQPGVPDAIGRFPLRSVSEVEASVDRILEIQEKENRTVSPEEATAILEGGVPADGQVGGAELGQFLEELSDTVAAKVEAQESPWRRTLREAAEAAEAEGFNTSRLRRLTELKTQPGDLEGILTGFRGAIRRLSEIKTRLEAVGNPWPEAAHGVLRDPERLDEAEALLASAEELARPFPEMTPGPVLAELGGQLPQLVIRAADQLVSTDRPEYNPLYVWSPDGVAARVLLQAAGRSKKVEEEGARVAWISVSSFAGEFIQALSTGVAGAWRERWWFADVLLVDGAQDLSATQRAQEELFHLFEALKRRGGRVMIAADRPPTAISALDERLRAGLEGGLVVEVQVEASELSSALREASEEPVPSSGSPEPASDSVAQEDREWIKSFQPGATGSSVRGQKGEGGEAVDSPEEGEGEQVVAEAWVPSPEQVVWDWPKLEERIVEDPD